MKDVTDRVAFITGGASGIGLGMAAAFAEAGMRVVVTDISGDHLQKASDHLAATGGRFHFIQLDVTDREGWARAADEAERVFGSVQVLACNAGMGVMGRISHSSFEDWDWVLGVCLGGAINGVQTFLGRMLASGEPGHIVATSSMAGLLPLGFSGIYSVAKRGVLGLMESLRGELLGSGIGVSVLCPGITRSNTWGSRVERPERYAGSGTPPQGPGDVGAGRLDLAQVAMDPEEVGRRVLAGIRRNDLYIITHAEMRDQIANSFDDLLAACDLAPAVVRPAARGTAGPPGLGAVYTPAGRTGGE